MTFIDPALAARVVAEGVPVSADLAGPKLRTLDQVEEELTGAYLSLYEEELETKRLRLALKSAKRRALRRLPHEREGLIFHLERENRQLHAFVRVANEAAQVSARGWEQYSGEVSQLREENARLRARVAELEVRIAAEECRCPEPAPLCEGCRCRCHAASVAEAPDGITRRIAPTQALREDPHDSPLHHAYRIPHDLPPLGGAW